ncbi:hypothetical protein IHE44_0002969, partial [Lamprotornis superbus]
VRNVLNPPLPPPWPSFQPPEHSKQVLQDATGKHLGQKSAKLACGGRSEAGLYFIQYQHNGALNWLQTGSTDTIMMRMAAVQSRASCSGAPETASERSFSVKRNNAGSVTVNGHCVPIDSMCSSGTVKYETASSVTDNCFTGVGDRFPFTSNFRAGVVASDEGSSDRLEESSFSCCWVTDSFSTPLENTLSSSYGLSGSSQIQKSYPSLCSRPSGPVRVSLLVCWKQISGHCNQQHMFPQQQLVQLSYFDIPLASLDWREKRQQSW